MGYAKGLFIGTVQFPSTVQEIPSLYVFSSGNWISCEKNNTTKRVTFTLPEDKRRTIFPIVITENVQWEMEDNSNTVKYLKIPHKQAYKLYTIELIKYTNEPKASGSHQGTPYTYEWIIEEETSTLKDGRLPDDAVVIYFDPAYIESLEGGSAFELPRIVIKKSIASRAGSEKKLRDLSDLLALSSPDLKAIHAKVETQVSQEAHRTLVTLVT